MPIIKEYILRNKIFINSLDKTTRVTLFILLAIQCIVYFYYLLVTPLHYDEWQSARSFSGASFWTILSYYPAPNNHVFYNLVSRLFVITGIDKEIAVRLPNLFASLLTTYYFFKICRHFFGPILSICLLAYVISLYRFVDYSFMGRGYSFLNLFCVLMIYSSWKLSENYSGKTYRAIFILSQFLGVFTVPTFLYVILPIYPILGIYILKQKRGMKALRSLLFDCLTSVLLVITAYSFILFTDDRKNLLHPNNAQDNFSFSEPDGIDKLISYLQDSFFELFDSKNLLLASILVIALFLYNLIRGKLHFNLSLSILMFFSPLIILSLHHVFAFGRNWLYLVFPVTLCFGFIIQAIFSVIKIDFIYRILVRYKILVYFFIISLTIFELNAFAVKRRSYFSLDYELSSFRKKMAPVLRDTLEVGKTETSYEFYPAEIICFFAEKDNPGKWIRNINLDENKREDILIINERDLEKYRRKLLSYNFSHKVGNFMIYLRKE